MTKQQQKTEKLWILIAESHRADRNQITKLN